VIVRLVDAAVGVTFAEQLAVPVAPGVNVHDAVPGVKATVPVGVVTPADVSVTVAVHDVAWAISTVAGVHATVVLVVCDATDVTVRPNVPLLVP